MIDTGPKSTHDSSPPKPWLNPMPRLWGGMEGETWILHAAWDRNRALREVFRQMSDPDNPLEKDLLRHGVSDKKEQKQLVTTLASVLTRYGTHLVEGDVIAMDHIKSVLRSIYASKLIQTLNVCELGESADVLEKDDSFIRIVKNSNVVLVCGPVGNPATDAFLNKAGLSWLFPKGYNQAHCLRTYPHDKKMLKPVGMPPGNLVKDCGVFLRCPNPYNPERRMYAAMGAYGFGTQGAAALACAEDATSELVSASVDNELRERKVDYCAWINVWKGEIEDTSPDSENKLTAFLDPEVRFRIAHPPHEGAGQWLVHKNQEDIDTTRDRLKAAFGEKTILARHSPVDALVYTVSLVVLVLVVLAIIECVKRPSSSLSSLVLLIPGAVFTGAVALKHLLTFLGKTEED